MGVRCYERSGKGAGLGWDIPCAPRILLPPLAAHRQAVISAGKSSRCDMRACVLGPGVCSIHTHPEEWMALPLDTD